VCFVLGLGGNSFQLLCYRAFYKPFSVACFLGAEKSALEFVAIISFYLLFDCTSKYKNMVTKTKVENNNLAPDKSTVKYNRTPSNGQARFLIFYIPQTVFHFVFNIYQF